MEINTDDNNSIGVLTPIPRPDLPIISLREPPQFPTHEPSLEQLTGYYISRNLPAGETLIISDTEVPYSNSSVTTETVELDVIIPVATNEDHHNIRSPPSNEHIHGNVTESSNEEIIVTNLLKWLNLLLDPTALVATDSILILRSVISSEPTDSPTANISMIFRIFVHAMTYLIAYIVSQMGKRLENPGSHCCYKILKGAYYIFCFLAYVSLVESHIRATPPLTP